MRMYRKISDDKDKAVYEYLWGDYDQPYIGLLEINKANEEVKIIKAADKEWSARKAGFYAMISLPKNGYPDRYTHTAV